MGYVIEQPVRTREITVGQIVNLIDVDGNIVPCEVLKVMDNRIIINLQNTRYLVHNSIIETAIDWN